MDTLILLLLICTAATTSAWSIPYYPVRSPVARLAAPPSPQHRIIAPFRITVPEQGADEAAWQRAKRDHHDDYDHDHRGNNGGVTGPIHTFVKTDKNANYKWGVRHHVGPKYV